MSYVLTALVAYAAGHWFGYWYGRWVELQKRRTAEDLVLADLLRKVDEHSR